MLYRCPGNDYNNTISASEAEKLHCKGVENASVTVIRSARPPASGRGRAASGGAARSAAVPAEAMYPAESAAVRTRASNARRSSKTGCRARNAGSRRSSRSSTAATPSASSSEIDLREYLDRVARMRSAIARKQIDIAELRREIDKLPTADGAGSVRRASPALRADCRCAAR